MADYTPNVWVDGNEFTAEQATELSSQLNEEEERNDAQNPLIASAQSTAAQALANAATALAASGTADGKAVQALADAAAALAAAGAAEESAEIVAAVARTVRPGGFTVGQYYFANSPGATSTNAALGFATLRLAPGLIVAPVSFDRLAFDVAAIGDPSVTFRPSVYADDGTGRPGARVCDGTDVPITATGAAESVVPLTTLQPGLYHWGGTLRGTGTQPTLRVINSANTPPLQLPLGSVLSAANINAGIFAWAKGAVPAGASPDPAGVIGVSGTPVPRLAFRVAAA